jgi:hypothetical protein
MGQSHRHSDKKGGREMKAYNYGIFKNQCCIDGRFCKYTVYEVKKIKEVKL